MTVKQVGRIVLALVFAGAAIWAAYAFVTMPYQMVATTTYRAQPDGGGTLILSVIFAMGALVSIFSDDWK